MLYGENSVLAFWIGTNALAWFSVIWYEKGQKQDSVYFWASKQESETICSNINVKFAAQTKLMRWILQILSPMEVHHSSGCLLGWDWQPQFIQFVEPLQQPCQWRRNEVSSKPTRIYGNLWADNRRSSAYHWKNQEKHRCRWVLGALSAENLMDLAFFQPRLFVFW